MDLRIRIEGLNPASEGGMLALVEQAVATLRIRTGLGITVTPMDKELPPTKFPGVRDKEREDLADRFSAIFEGSNVLRAEVVLLSDRYIDEMSAADIERITLRRQECADIRAGAQVALAAVNDAQLGVYGAIVVDDSGSVVFKAKSDVGGFGLVFLDESKRIYALHPWKDTLEDAHAAAMLAAISAPKPGSPWCKIEVVDYRASKVAPKVLAEVNL